MNRTIVRLIHQSRENIYVEEPTDTSRDTRQGARVRLNHSTRACKREKTRKHTGHANLGVWNRIIQSCINVPQLAPTPRQSVSARCDGVQ